MEKYTSMLDDFLRIQDVINNYNNIISNYKSRGYSTTLVNITTLGDKAADDYISFQDMTTLLNNISNDTQGISTDYFNLIFPTLDEEIDNIIFSQLEFVNTKITQLASCRNGCNNGCVGSCSSSCSASCRSSF